MTKLYSLQAQSRPSGLFGEPYSRVDMQSMLLSHEYLGPVMEQAPKMRSLPFIAQTFDDGINDEIITYLGNAINSTVNGLSYSSVLSTAQTGISAALKKYNYQ